MGDAFIADVRRMVDDNPGRSMRSIARELNVSDSTVRKVVKKKLKRKSFALKKGQFMNAATKERRLEKAKKLFGRIKRPAERGALIFFSDEKNFTQDQKVNRKNNRWICECFEYELAEDFRLFHFSFSGGVWKCNSRCL